MTYDVETGRYTPPEEQTMVLADESGPCFLPGPFLVITATFSVTPKTVHHHSLWRRSVPDPPSSDSTTIKAIDLTSRKWAREAGLMNVTFAVATSTDYPGKRYDFVAHFDCLYDMGDPFGDAKHVKKTLAQNGTWMIVEPFATIA